VISTRIDWVREHCRLLRGIAAEFGRTRPFHGLTIGTGIHLEAKTVALLLTLRDGGARLISTGNLNTTQPDAVDRLRAEGITVIGEPTKDGEVHAGYLGEVLTAADGPRLRPAGTLPGGGRPPQRRRHQLRCPGSRAHRRGRRAQLPGSQVPPLTRARSRPKPAGKR
jgi:hypothetical protein